MTTERSRLDEAYVIPPLAHPDARSRIDDQYLAGVRNLVKVLNETAGNNFTTHKKESAKPISDKIVLVKAGMRL